jgi:uncharacterized protein (TIGR02145 family)/uncharacterized repeat protein (TIGR02543 family)
MQLKPIGSVQSLCFGGTVFCDDFTNANHIGAYTIQHGDWVRGAGKFYVIGDSQKKWIHAKALLGGNYADFDVTIKGHSMNDADFGICYAMDTTSEDTGNGFAVFVHPVMNSSDFHGVLLKRLNSAKTDIDIDSTPFPIDTLRKELVMRVQRKRTTITVWLNGQQILPYDDGGFDRRHGKIGLILSVSDKSESGGAEFSLFRLDSAKTWYSYRIIFDDQGATTPVNLNAKIVAYPDTITGIFPSAPERTGYCFGGWFTEQNGGGKQFTANTIVTADMTVYANWIIQSIIQDKDGNIYKGVKIGNQVWMVGNLKTTKFNDGTDIPLITDDTAWVNCQTPAYCWYNNDASNKETYGAIYNWYAIKSGKLSPVGWHIPTSSEWYTLENWLDSNGYDVSETIPGNTIGKSLAAQWGWDTSTVIGAVGNDLFKNNSTGFSAVAGGHRSDDGRFGYIREEAMWWVMSNSISRVYIQSDMTCLTFYGISCCGSESGSVVLLRDK